MNELVARLAELRRPSLLIQAARHGTTDYCRARDLPRLIGEGRTARPDRAIAALMEEEERLETTRRQGEAGYNLVRHIDVMIALMGEARLLAPA